MRGQSPDLWLSGTAGVLWPGDRRRSGGRVAVRHAGVAVDRAREPTAYPPATAGSPQPSDGQGLH